MPIVQPDMQSCKVTLFFIKEIIIIKLYAIIVCNI